MTASEEAKSYGHKSLKQVSEAVGVSRHTLANWHKYKPQLFRSVLRGAQREA